jgi:type IV pilus assembly protein PilM
MNPPTIDRSSSHDRPVIETAPGAVACYRCSHTNTSDRRYCSQCGSSLWLPCPSCSQQCAVTETFCGACGANLEHAVHERCDEYTNTLQRVETVWQQGDFRRALELLRPLSRLEDPRYHQFHQRARELVEQIQPEFERACTDAQRAYERAEHQVSQQDYSAARNELESVPVPLRSRRASDLLTLVSAREEEVRRLNAEVKYCVKTGQLTGLGGKLERLLALKPAHETARRLAIQYRDRQIRVAKARLNEHAYQRALAALEEIPALAWNDEAEKVKSEAAELEWMTNDLKQAAVADKTLLTIARRLLQLRPQDDEATQWAQRIRTAIGRKPRDLRLAAVDLSRPESSVLGIPVDWLAFPQRLGMTGEAEDALRHRPGSFWVACGLAVQGVEQADVTINLLAERSKSSCQKGILQRLAAVRRKPPSAAWGIDLGSTSLKAVKLVVDGNDRNTLTIERAVRIAHERQVIRSSDTLERREVFGATLRKFLDQHVVDQAQVCLGMPNLAILGRFFQLPAMDAKRMGDAVAYETRQLMPVPLDELAWDFHARPLPPPVHGAEQVWRVAVYAAKRFHVQEVEAICEHVQLKPDVLSGNCVALHNLAMFELLASRESTSTEPEAVAMLDVGSEGSALVISSTDSSWFRHLPVGGQTMTGNLTRALKLTWAQAEEIKSNPARARRLKPLYEAIDPALCYLTDEIKRSLHQYDQLFPNVPVKHLFGMGGGFCLHGLMRRLRSG